MVIRPSRPPDNVRAGHFSATINGGFQRIFDYPRKRCQRHLSAKPDGRELSNFNELGLFPYI